MGRLILIILICLSLFANSQIKYKPYNTESIMFQNQENQNYKIDLKLENTKILKNSTVPLIWIGCAVGIGIISLSHWSSPQSSSEVAYYSMCGSLITISTILTISKSNKKWKRR